MNLRAQPRSSPLRMKGHRRDDSLPAPQVELDASGSPMALILEARDHRLVLEGEGDDDWGALTVETRSERVTLGADVVRIIKSRLSDGLQRPIVPIGDIDGLPVEGILNLSDPHHTLYVAQLDNGGRVLFFTDAEGKCHHRLPLSRDELSAWVALLTADPETAEGTP